MHSPNKPISTMAELSHALASENPNDILRHLGMRVSRGIAIPGQMLSPGDDGYRTLQSKTMNNLPTSESIKVHLSGAWLISSLMFIICTSALSKGLEKLDGSTDYGISPGVSSL